MTNKTHVNFDHDSKFLIVSKEHKETRYEEQKTGLTQIRAKQIAKELRETYNRKARVVKRGRTYSVYVEIQSWE